MQTAQLNTKDKENKILLFTLTLGVFAIISSSLGIMGLVPIIALKFSISSTKAAHIVSYFAFIVMLFAPLTPLICEKIKPKPLMLLILSLFCISAFGSIFASSFEILLFFRLLPAFLHPVYIALALSLAAHSSKDKKQSARAISFVFMGMSMGMVLGVSIATFLGSHFSFEWAMGFFFALNLLCFCTTFFFVKPLSLAQSSSFKAQSSILSKPLLWISVLAVFVCVAAIYGFYSFLSDFLHNSAGFDFGFISLALFVYGLFSVLGNFLAGKVLSYEKMISFALAFLMIGLYFLLFLGEKHSVLMIFILALLGVLSGMANNLTQFLISSPFEKAKELTNGLFVSFSNLGISFGVFVCGLFIEYFSLDLLVFVPVILLGFFCVILFVRIFMQKV
ncbi:MFS transporter [Campylobacter sp. MIT 12-5580]|uniref:MFS transporter n=1 Tax=Campylobacter sp. MIT 12-5580 TaxID=2040651 RepID=UPI0010F79D36|nr:MFS transporter [Campylobacter sp. MIT 12-5580]TKX29669.1 MFS transporter [Campylobacter sp. MIT 12-5580]